MPRRAGYYDRPIRSTHRFPAPISAPHYEFPVDGGHPRGYFYGAPPGAPWGFSSFANAAAGAPPGYSPYGYSSAAAAAAGHGSYYHPYATPPGAPWGSSSSSAIVAAGSSPTGEGSSWTPASAGAHPGSSSAIIAGAATGYHVLKIEGYSRTKVVPNGQYIESTPFVIGGHTWTIKYYPNGVSADVDGFISLFLVIKDPITEPLMVQFWFSFIDQLDQQTPYYISSVPSSTFSNEGAWGRHEFIKIDHLALSGRVRDDCFTVRVDMMVASEIRSEGTSSSVVVPPSDCLQHFRALLLSGQGADVSFLVGGRTFKAHRCVLAARSPVFNAQLFGAMREGTSTEDHIQIDDMAPEVFESLLHFIYTDSLEMEWQDKATAVAMTQHMLEAADRYDMERLKLICEDRLCQYIEVSSVATTLALAEQHHCQGLKEACYEFIRSSRTLNEVMETEGFQHLAKSCPSALFELMSKLAAY